MKNEANGTICLLFILLCDPLSLSSLSLSTFLYLMNIESIFLSFAGLVKLKASSEVHFNETITNVFRTEKRIHVIVHVRCFVYWCSCLCIAFLFLVFILVVFCWLVRSE